MNGTELLDKMELIDAAYVESADAVPKRQKRRWIGWNVAAACLCLAIGAAVIIPRFIKTKTLPKAGEIVLSDRTTAKVSYGYEGELYIPGKAELVYFSEEEMFAQEDIVVFRGKIEDLTNITVDFNGMTEYFCIASIEVGKVYRGDFSQGDTIRLLIDCPIGVDGVWFEDSGIISQIEVGMEGIFMPRLYDNESFFEMNGAVLMLRDIADCGLGDGMRWVFLSSDKGLIYFDEAYPGARGSINLDDIEKYVLKMLNNT